MPRLLAHERARRRRASAEPLPALQGGRRGDRRASGLAWTIFRPSVIFGREDRSSTCSRGSRAVFPVIALGRRGRALPAGLRRRRRALLRAGARGRRDDRRALRPVRPQGLHARRARRYVGEMTGRCVRSLRSHPALSTLQAGARAAAGQAVDPRQPCVDAGRQRLRAAFPGIRHRARGARGDRAGVSRAARAAQPLRPVARTRRPMTRPFPQPVHVYRVGGSVRDEVAITRGTAQQFVAHRPADAVDAHRARQRPRHRPR